MERRYGPREPVSLDVEIYHGEYRLGRFKSRNIGFEGMFIATAHHLGLSVGELVTIRLTLEPSDIKSYALGAIIAHQSEDGIGLMFTDDDPIFFRVLDAVSDAAA